MRRFHVRALLTCAVFVCTLAAQAQSSPEATARQFLDAFNAGDMAKAASFNASSGMSIVDEFAPYSWSGSTGFSDWGAAFGTNAKAHEITESKVTLGPILVNNATANQAYLIFPSVYTYKEKGVATREAARMAIVLHKEGGKWKVAAFTWTGTVPKAAAN
jgi:hypothetical protein